MVGRVIYGVIGGGALLFWGIASQTGWDSGGKAYKLPPSVRQSPGGYRSFFFWHAGYQAGK
jgi:hypothetical protein